MEVVHALSREPVTAQAAAGFRTGRVGKVLIEEFLGDPSEVEIFACGPAVGKWERLEARQSGSEPKSRFMETVLQALADLGVPGDRIHRESYG